ncbi:MAG: hypothetical protein FJW80_09385 [Actinobacteria bacterium]|nr:hypothetical protein [Actinomycetota bacterium]
MKTFIWSGLGITLGLTLVIRHRRRQPSDALGFDGRDHGVGQAFFSYRRYEQDTAGSITAT